MRKLVWLTGLLTMLLFLTEGIALGEAATLQLPTALEIIEEEAFYGTELAARVIVPNGTLRIEDNAFAYSGVKEVVLPSSLQHIADNAFLGCEDLIVEAIEGTYAYEWAEGHSLTIRQRLNLTGVSCDLETTMTGEPVIWTANVSGGAEPYSYQWEIYWGDVQD